MRTVLSVVLLLSPLTGLAQVSITRQVDRITVDIDKKPFTTFYYGASVTKPYLWPLKTSDGVEVTRHWPMDAKPGERHDHIHHRGVWFAHSNVNGFDFWNSDPSYTNPKMGRIVVAHMGKVEGGLRAGSIQADLDWMDPSGKVLLREARVMTFHAGEPRVIDFDFKLTAAAPVVFGDDKDGVFGMRLAPEFEELLKDSPPDPPRTGVMISSTGCHQERDCWGKRAKWMDVSAKIDGKEVGIAIFDNPANPRFPTYWHVRGYGLFAANIFGVKAFTKDPQANGALQLPEGGTLRFRYRVVIHSGGAQKAGIAEEYAAYAGR
jgi:hypothetical protein